MKILVIVLMFFIVGALIVVSNNNLALKEDENLLEFMDLYRGWLNKVYENSKILTGEIISSKWFPE